MIPSGIAVPVAVPSDHDIILALGEDLPVGIWVARVPDGELIYANRAYADFTGTGAYTSAPAGRHGEPYSFCARDGTPYPETKLPFARALIERRVIVIDDLTIRRRDGRKVEVRAIARPIGDPITHVVVTFLDIGREVEAERARAESEQRLRHAQRLEAIGALASGIAHDFNNLIFSIKLIAAEIAAAELDPKRRAAMQMIDDLTERSATLTRALLGFVRRTKHRALPVGVNDIVTSMTEVLGRTLSGVELRFEIEASDRGTVVADHAQLEQVLMTLVLNAHDAVQGTGRIVVRTADRTPPPGDPEAARFVLLEVKDDGPGILPEVSDHVVDAGPSEFVGSSDLGLSSVFAIVEGHGGTVEVDAGIDGTGTTMRVVLPAARRQAAMRSATTSAELPRGNGLVLVVDDDQMVRKVVAGSLGTLGYKTIQAVSGPDAIEIYRARHGEIRAVVLDMVMPGMTGKATYLGLREIDRNVAVLLMSGNTFNDQVQEILDLGVRNFVAKPYSIAALAVAIAELTR